MIHAENIRGPWSDPIDLDLPNHIDPGHIVGDFLSLRPAIYAVGRGLVRVREVQYEGMPA